MATPTFVLMDIQHFLGVEKNVKKIAKVLISFQEHFSSTVPNFYPVLVSFTSLTLLYLFHLSIASRT